MKGIADHKKLLYIFLVLESLLILVIHLYNINSLYGFFLSEDELGYWGNAAYFAGKNWGNAVEFLPYYSFGYSFFLAFILSLPVSALTMYHLAIFLNAVFILLSYYISFYLFIHLFPDINKIFISIACTALALYSAYVSWSSVAWSECCLTFFVWLIILQAYLIIQKKSMLRILVFAFELGLIYMVHQRTISLLIAGVIYIVVLFLQKKIKLINFISFIVTFLIMLIIAFLIKTSLQDAVYHSGNLGNDYSSIFSKMSIINLVFPVILEAGGEILYLWTSSFGIIPLGIVVTVSTIIKKWKEKDEIYWFYGYVLLSFLGILGISSIFMRLGINGVHKLIYGRYIEIAIGFFVIIAFLKLSEIYEKKVGRLILYISFFVLLGLGLMLRYKINAWNIPIDTYYQGVCAAGIFAFYQRYGFSILKLCILCIMVEIFWLLLFKIFKSKWLIFCEIVFIAICWMFSGETVIQKQIIPYQLDNNIDLSDNARFWEFINRNEISIGFLSKTSCNNKGNIQFYMKNKPLEIIINLDEMENKPDVLIVDNDTSIMSNDLEGYLLEGFIGNKCVYAHENIRIEGLKKELSANSFSYNEIPESESGYIMYGPYIVLPAGEYEFTFNMDGDIGKQNEILGTLEVVSNGKVLSTTLWNGDISEVTIRVQMKDKANTIECRYFRNSDNTTKPKSVFVRNIDKSR